MSYATIDALRSQLGGKAAHSPEYVAKMMHPIPPATTVDRTVFILQHVAGKRVLEFGASGPMHDAIVKAATLVVGIDREDGPEASGVFGFDLDDVSKSGVCPAFAWPGRQGIGAGINPPDIIVCGEILEHLSNPGWFLTRLKRQYSGVPVLITVPNAFSEIGARSIVRGVEQVNRDHVSYYSYKTMLTLLERHGYVLQDFHWYHGKPLVAEGLIFVCS